LCDKTKIPLIYPTNILSNRENIKQDVIHTIQLQQNKKCNYEMLLADKYGLDHIKPITSGGNNERDNLQILCVSCHREEVMKGIANMLHKLKRWIY
jgi:5-methylcytosine-specific restriction endonuclease McrA